jgi:ATP-dependent HslUV protease ATP-binding subunit HslU
VIEKVVEDISFDASERQGEKIELNGEHVRQKVGDLLKAVDMKKYIL